MTEIEKPVRKRRWTIYGASAFVLFILLFIASLTGSAQLTAAKRAEAVNQASQIETAVLNYYTEYSVVPAASNNAQLIKMLTGNSPRKIEFISLKPTQLNANGELIDPWGTPFRITFDTDSKVHIISAGPDKIFGTADDITNQ